MNNSNPQPETASASQNPRTTRNFGEILKDFDNPYLAVREVFDGHRNLDEALDHWYGMPEDSVAFTPRGYEINRETILQGHFGRSLNSGRPRLTWRKRLGLRT